MKKDVLDKLQAFHTRSQGQILLYVHWYDSVRNSEVPNRTLLPHIGILIPMWHDLYSHVVCMNPLSPAHVALQLSGDMSMNHPDGMSPVGMYETSRPSCPEMDGSSEEGHWCAPCYGVD